MSRWLGAVAAMAAVLLCGCAGPVGRTGSTAGPLVSASPSASAAGPCASVTVTTAIADVPAACAAAWAPYGVTKVPPVNLLAGTPKPPPVVDETDGAVSQATADAWALALNHASRWSQWAEANAQYELTLHYEGASVVNTQIDQLMRAGYAIIEPACDEYPTSLRLRPVDDALTRFLAMYGEATKESYAFVASLPGPCEVDDRAPDGTTHVLARLSSAVTTLAAGGIQHDPLLGDVWLVDAGGLCTKPGAPTSWCN